MPLARRSTASPASTLTLSRQGSPESTGLDSLLSISLDPGLGAFAGPACREYLLHRRPIGLDPSAIMAAVAIGWNSDLGEFELRPAANPRDIKDGNGVMVRPPAGGAPCLHDLLAWIERQIEP